MQVLGGQEAKEE